MKYCGKCGAPLREGKGFCPQCGAEVRHPEPVAEPIAEPIPEPVAAPVAEQPSAPAAVKERRPRRGLRRLVTALIVLVLLGGLGAFLTYNFHPAKAFMGDTGSLFLGGAVCGLAFALDIPLVLILVGLVYLVETLSDIIQVVYFKLTHGKRIFKMAPIHHHFEMCGWSEEKIFTVVVGITCLMCVAAWFGVQGRYAP